MPPATPTLEPELWQHPAEPKAGEAVTLVVWSGNTEPNDAPTLVGELTNRDGTRQIADYTVVNDELDRTVSEMAAIVARERLKSVPIGPPERPVRPLS